MNCIIMVDSFSWSYFTGNTGKKPVYKIIYLSEIDKKLNQKKS